MSPETVAVVVAHPDDEVLAFGGTMARHADAGDAVHVLILATGLASRTPDGSLDARAAEALRGEAREANRILGVRQVQFADFPDNRMDSVALLDVVKRVESFLEETSASTVYTHHLGDTNVDHGVTARSVLAAARPLPGAKVRRLYAGEILSSSEYTFPDQRFRPNAYVGIEAGLERKCRAMEAYRGEIRQWPHPRSVEAIRAQARLRGSEIGVEAAEALDLIRGIIL